MIYRIIADLIVIVHVAYVLFVLLGLVLTIVGGAMKWNWVCNRWFRGVHLAMILFVVFEAWIGMTCPLTTWEQEFRGAAEQQTYQGDFVANWAPETLFFAAPPWVFTAAYTFLGGLVLATLLLVPPQWKGNSIVNQKPPAPS